MLFSYSRFLYYQIVLDINRKLESVTDGVWNMPNETCNSGL